MKKNIRTLLVVLSFAFIGIAFTNAASTYTLTIDNKSGKQLYVYNSKDGKKLTLKTGSNSLSFSGDANRFWITEEEFTGGTGAQPGPGPNSSIEATTSDAGWTLDQTVIDWWYYPMTLTYEGKEYGLKNADAAVTAIEALDSPWNTLVYRAGGAGTDVTTIYGPGVPFTTTPGGAANVHPGQETFWKTYNATSTKLAPPAKDMDTWNGPAWDGNTPRPWTKKVLYSNALQNKGVVADGHEYKGRMMWGFYTYPQQGSEFTNQPMDKKITITIYPGPGKAAAPPKPKGDVGAGEKPNEMKPI